jgi:pilus assembly protein CpaF
MLSRLEMMVLMGTELPLQAIRQQIAMGIDIMIHLERGRDHKRKVVEIAELIGVSNGEIQWNLLYQYQGDLKRVGDLKGTLKWERCFGEVPKDV